MLSHGFLSNIIKKDDLKIVNFNLINFLIKNDNKESYFSEINKNIPCVYDLINQKVLSKVKELLCTDNPFICNVELHILPRNSQIIPAHQDNFYHCINPNEGLKILIPLQSMKPSSGSLTFMDCDVNFPVQKHVSSTVKNFSSYIPKDEFDKLDFKKTTYNYELGDASYHFTNSIHFSDGNHSNSEIYFVVFRFQIPNATINKKALSIYEECFSNHKKLLK